MTSQDQFCKAVVSRRLVRPSVRAIVVRDRMTLVQKPSDEPSASYAFIGGEYEYGDTIESRIRREFEEETNARVLSWSYLFVVENHFLWEGALMHGLEHYVEVTLDRTDVEPGVDHLQQHWLPLNRLGQFDLRPEPVRDALASGQFRAIRHLLVQE
ncbi:MAG TPA: NUDIX domain-containing protein [Dehalococcoidia bacterium]|nr:NUDIX domain-containing protein [Dehalococcoidia bacterium]